MPYKDPAVQNAYVVRWAENRRQEWLKENGPCVDCGSWERLEVDHQDPSTKLTHRVWHWREERRNTELAKCVVRCEACHRKKTSAENRLQFSRSITHGIVSAYLQRGCRCDICKAFYKKWRRDKYERIGK